VSARSSRLPKYFNSSNSTVLKLHWIVVGTPMVVFNHPPQKATPPFCVYQRNQVYVQVEIRHSGDRFALWHKFSQYLYKMQKSCANGWGENWVGRSKVSLAGENTTRHNKGTNTHTHTCAFWKQKKATSSRLRDVTAIPSICSLACCNGQFYIGPKLPTRLWRRRAARENQRLLRFKSPWNTRRRPNRH